MLNCSFICNFVLNCIFICNLVLNCIFICNLVSNFFAFECKQDIASTHLHGQTDRQKDTYARTLAYSNVTLGRRVV